MLNAPQRWDYADPAAVVWEWPQGPRAWGVWYATACKGECRAVGIQLWRLTVRVIWHCGNPAGLWPVTN